MTDIQMRSDSTVQLVRHTAQDSDVVCAARVSTVGARSLDDVNATPNKSAGLINYLMGHRHGSPFEHTSMTFYLETPIFVVREFVRHRVGWSYNETSGRYRELEPVFYTPAPDRPLVQVGKPSRYTLTDGAASQYAAATDHIWQACDETWQRYQAMLAAGIAREVARTVLPVGTYSSLYATCNARSLMHFLSLRTTDHRAAVPSTPQWEIARVADQMETHFAQLMPLTYAAYNEHGRLAP